MLFGIIKTFGGEACPDIRYYSLSIVTNSHMAVLVVLVSRVLVGISILLLPALPLLSVAIVDNFFDLVANLLLAYGPVSVGRVL